LSFPISSRDFHIYRSACSLSLVLLTPLYTIDCLVIGPESAHSAHYNSYIKHNHYWLYAPLGCDSHLLWGVTLFPLSRGKTFSYLLDAVLCNSFVLSGSLDSHFLNWVEISIAIWRKTSAPYGLSDDSVQILNIFIFVIECYSESEQEDPEMTGETPQPPYSSSTSSPLVCTDMSSLLVIDHMWGHHSFPLDRNCLDR
jgi:hypothetical protein